VLREQLSAIPASSATISSGTSQRCGRSATARRRRAQVERWVARYSRWLGQLVDVALTGSAAAFRREVAASLPDVE
jgi:hypothetical protein